MSLVPAHRCSSKNCHEQPPRWPKRRALPPVASQLDLSMQGSTWLQDADFSSDSGSTKYIPLETPPPTPPKRRNSPSSPRFSKRYNADNASTHIPVVRWRIESQTIFVGLLVLCATSAYVVTRFGPIIASSAAIMHSSAGVMDAGAGLTFRVGDILLDVSNVATGTVYGVGRAWCQTVGVGCLKSNPPTTEVASDDTDKGTVVEADRRKRNGALMEGGLIVDGLHNLRRLGENASASIDMQSLGLELGDKAGFNYTMRWSQDLVGMAPSYHQMREEKTMAFSKTFALLQNVIDRHNNALKRGQLKRSTSSWYNRPSQRHHYEALSTDVTYMVRQVNEELIQARSSLSLTARVAKSIYKTSENMLANVKYRLRKLREYRERHPVIDTICYSVGDFELGPVVCDAFERDRMISLLETLVGTLDHYVSDTGELAMISKKLDLELYSFVGALNDTAGVIPDQGRLRLRAHRSDLLLLGDGVSALSTNLNEISLI